MTAAASAPEFFPRVLLKQPNLLGWIGQASPGDVLEYHRGFLVVDRNRLGRRLEDGDAGELSRVADCAWRAAELGLVHLLQRRIGRDVFSYLAVARDRPAGAVSALIETTPHRPQSDLNEGKFADAA